ncbi:MAG: site-specific DNA-methyltransferase [Candidatus Nitrosopumilus sp. bin_68KS]
MPTKINQVLHGNSIKLLQKFDKETVDLCYLDPPFFAGRTFEAKGKYGKINSFSDTWDRNLDSYLDSMIQVLQECHRVLKNTGSLYLHCDWHASHYLKVELDKIFGRKFFQNEIVWKRHNVHNNTRHGTKSFGRVHDVIFFYTKSNDYTWNPIYQPYSDEYVKKTYRHVESETGRKYALGDLSGPGGRSKGNPRYKFMGITRYWRYCERSMKRLKKENRIYQGKPGNVPLLKRYLDEMPGIVLQDVWDDVQSVQVSKKESTGYPTQKPERLLERIIQVSSNENDVVLDPMCGSGTTLVASKNLRRQYIGIDLNKDACKIAKNRILKREIYEFERVNSTVVLP